MSEVLPAGRAFPYDVLITLSSVDGCTTRFWASQHEAPVVWEPSEPENQTTTARFEHYNQDGNLVDGEDLDGAEWRDLEDSGELAYVFFWIKRGVSLRDTLDACVLGVDPEGYDHKYEEFIDALKKQIAELEAENARLRALLGI